MDNDQQLIWEAYQVINESLTAAEALERIRGAVANGYSQIIPDILDAVDNKDKQALFIVDKNSKGIGLVDTPLFSHTYAHQNKVNGFHF